MFFSKGVVVGFLMIAVLSAAACSTPGIRANNANRLAFPVFMIPRNLSAEGMTIKAFERVHKKGDVATIYIEGSGDVMVDRVRVSNDPTPKRPVGLELASNDTAQNVIWMARPCQYGLGGKDCATDYLTTRMFAPEILSAYNAMLDEIKSRYQLTGFHLVGFGSGGGLAALMTAARHDVKSLRTVAGLLDTATYAKVHGLAGYELSLNPINVVPDLVNIPQHHYIAQYDQVIPNAVYHSYAQAFADDRCLGYTFVQDVDHTYDWAENWPAFSRDVVTCVGPNPDDVERASRARVYAPQIGPKK